MSPSRHHRARRAWVRCSARLIFTLVLGVAPAAHSKGEESRDAQAEARVDAKLRALREARIALLRQLVALEPNTQRREAFAIDYAITLVEHAEQLRGRASDYAPKAPQAQQLNAAAEKHEADAEAAYLKAQSTQPDTLYLLARLQRDRAKRADELDTPEQRARGGRLRMEAIGYAKRYLAQLKDRTRRVALYRFIADTYRETKNDDLQSAAYGEIEAGLRLAPNDPALLLYAALEAERRGQTEAALGHYTHLLSFSTEPGHTRDAQGGIARLMADGSSLEQIEATLQSQPPARRGALAQRMAHSLLIKARAAEAVVVLAGPVANAKAPGAKMRVHSLHLRAVAALGQHTELLADLKALRALHAKLDAKALEPIKPTALQALDEVIKLAEIARHGEARWSAVAEEALATTYLRFVPQANANTHHSLLLLWRNSRLPKEAPCDQRLMTLPGLVKVALSGGAESHEANDLALRVFDHCRPRTEDTNKPSALAQDSLLTEAFVAGVVERDPERAGWALMAQGEAALAAHPGGPGLALLARAIEHPGDQFFTAATRWLDALIRQRRWADLRAAIERLQGDPRLDLELKKILPGYSQWAQYQIIVAAELADPDRLEALLALIEDHVAQTHQSAIELHTARLALKLGHSGQGWSLLQRVAQRTPTSPPVRRASQAASIDCMHFAAKRGRLKHALKAMHRYLSLPTDPAQLKTHQSMARRTRIYARFTDPQAYVQLEGGRTAKELARFAVDLLAHGHLELATVAAKRAPTYPGWSKWSPVFQIIKGCSQAKGEARLWAALRAHPTPEAGTPSYLIWRAAGLCLLTHFEADLPQPKAPVAPESVVALTNRFSKQLAQDSTLLDHYPPSSDPDRIALRLNLLLSAKSAGLANALRASEGLEAKQAAVYLEKMARQIYKIHVERLALRPGAPLSRAVGRLQLRLAGLNAGQRPGFGWPLSLGAHEEVDLEDLR